MKVEKKKVERKKGNDCGNVMIREKGYKNAK